VLAGAGSGVHRNDRALSAARLALAREFRSVASQSRPNHVPIPVMFGIDAALHGHNNIVGAVIFPHNTF